MRSLREKLSRFKRDKKSCYFVGLPCHVHKVRKDITAYELYGMFEAYSRTPDIFTFQRALDVMAQYETAVLIVSYYESMPVDVVPTDSEGVYIKEHKFPPEFWI